MLRGMLQGMPWGSPWGVFREMLRGMYLGKYRRLPLETPWGTTPRGKPREKFQGMPRRNILLQLFICCKLTYK